MLEFFKIQKNRGKYHENHNRYRQRNYYCHQCALDFCYDPYFRESIEFKDSLEQLERTNEIIKSVQAQTSGHRSNVLARYNRV